VVDEASVVGVGVAGMAAGANDGVEDDRVAAWHCATEASGGGSFGQEFELSLESSVRGEGEEKETHDFQIHINSSIN
jgi:hypothetical protein